MIYLRPVPPLTIPIGVPGEPLAPRTPLPINVTGTGACHRVRRRSPAHSHRSASSHFHAYRPPADPYRGGADADL